MCPKSVWVFWIVWICSCITIECNAHYSKDKSKGTPKSITCYECNSEYDPRCGDPFDPYTIGSVNCSMKKPLDHMTNVKPILCRKLVQRVHNKIRVIRGCGYIPDKYDDKDCAKRTGTHEIDAWYCSCTKSLCNTGHLVKDPSLKIVFITSIFMTALASLIRTA